MLEPTALTTLENLKAEIGEKTTANDAVLCRLINRASSWIETQTNRNLKARNYGETDDGYHSETEIDDEDYLYFSGDKLDDGGDTLCENGRGVFYLPQWPVQSNDQLEFKLESLTSREDDTWEELEENVDYVIERKQGKLVLLSGAFTPGYRNYRVQACAGYLVSDENPFVPNDLEGLCIELAREIYEDKQNLQSESIGTWSRSFNTQKDKPFVQDTLDKYTRLVI